MRNIRYAVRRLLRSPGFSLIAITTLGLGVGATAAIFALLDAVVLRPLPYPDADRLVWIDSRIPGFDPDAAWGVSQAGYFHFRNNNRTFDEIGATAGAFGETRFNLASDGGAERVDAAMVTSSVLDVLRARPAVGRLIEADDDAPGATPVAVLGHEFWMRQFGGDRSVVGTNIRLDSQPYEIVGVLEPGIRPPERAADVWLPLQLDASRRPVNDHGLQAVGRLRDGASVADAQRDLARLTGQFSQLFPGAYDESFMREFGFETRVQALRAQVIGDIDRTLWILLAAVGLVLLIAFANVANLFLVRIEAGRREVAIRSALGAERRHILLQYVADGLVIGAAAGGVGLLFAASLTRMVVALAPEGIPRLDEVGVGASTLGFTAAVALTSGLLLGLLPLLRSLIDFGLLREGGRGLTASVRQNLLRGAMVVGQVALAMVLLVAAGLMLRSFQQLRNVEPGLEPANVLTAEVSLPWAGYQSYEEVARFYKEVIGRVEALPGVASAGATQALPLTPGAAGCASLFVEDRPLQPDEQPPCLGTAAVAPGFFQTLGISIRGSAPGWSEIENAAAGVVVTEALAERFWPGEDPIGKGIRPNGQAPPYYRVVGVTSELRGEGLDQPPWEAVFFPTVPVEGAPMWSPPRSMKLVVKTRTDRPLELTGAIRRVVSEIDPAVPLGNVRTMEQVVAQSVSRAAFTMFLLGIAGAMALLLSAVGIYGVISYIVSQRTAEIGIRMALGAQMRQAAGMVVRQSVLLAGIGLVVGVVAAVLVSGVLQSMLFEISPTDPVTLVGAALVLMAVALLAAAIPARRAARVDPMVALRAE